MNPVLLLILAGVLLMPLVLRRRSGAFPHAPLAGALVVTSPFGDRAAFTQGGVRHPASFHAGIDLRADHVDAFAVDDGKIESLENGSAGMILRLRTVGGERVSYVHMSAFHVALGDTVVGGQRIATTGSTGTNAPHLHLEVRAAGASTGTNPAPYLGV